MIFAADYLELGDRGLQSSPDQHWVNRSTDPIWGFAGPTLSVVITRTEEITACLTTIHPPTIR